MKEYELVREIQNSCPNNQMRDVFFEEILCESPAHYVRQLLQGRMADLTENPGPDGAVTIHAEVDGLRQKFVFTPI